VTDSPQFLDLRRWSILREPPPQYHLPLANYFRI
jgi:hypothetical protein